VAKPARPVCRSTAFWVLNGQGKVWIQKRAQGSMLENLWELPHTGFSVALARQQTEALEAGAHPLESQSIQHIFSHFTLHMVIAHKPFDEVAQWIDQANGEWVLPDGLIHRPMSALMKKAFDRMING
jgi:adenine-specific DNA glycosylase